MASNSASLRTPLPHSASDEPLVDTPRASALPSLSRSSLDGRQISSIIVDGEASQHSQPILNPEEHCVCRFSPGMQRIWDEYFKGNPFAYSLSKYRHEVPDEDCLVWLSHEVTKRLCISGRRRVSSYWSKRDRSIP